MRVAIDDGSSPDVITNTAGDGYSFSVSPRFACVTASKTGYNTVTQCKQVEPGIINYNSLVMFPVGTGTDAGITDAATDVDGSNPVVDGAGGDGGNPGAPDGGDPSDGGGGGCCSTSGGASDPRGVAGLALAVVFGLCGIRSRRRRT